MSTFSRDLECKIHSDYSVVISEENYMYAKWKSRSLELWYALIHKEIKELLREEAWCTHKDSKYQFLPISNKLLWGEPAGTAFNCKVLKRSNYILCIFGWYKIGSNLVIGSCHQKLLVTFPFSAFPHIVMGIY